ncbi:MULTISPECIES: hypothetical protein [Rhodobacterales]|uniref:hypothetical protein n=1 Tax=Rhodobacterales TaxID=204455 RepID=UPI0011BF93CD|nr:MULTISPECIES: hypothetical protein [Rhodobacterales]MDO6588672.1 hypothetical protein [Yoonia sp. 1_MG-2023]
MATTQSLALLLEALDMVRDERIRALAEKDVLYRRELGRRRRFQRLLIQAEGFNAYTTQPDFMPVRIKRSPAPRGTFLICGSMGGGDMISKLEFEGTLSSVNCDQIYIKDFEKIWYQNGLMGMTENREETINFLKSLLQDFPRPLTVLGASAGGYAALLFGHALDAERIVTFGAQTLLTRHVVRVYSDPRDHRTRFRHDMPENDLRKVLIENPLSGHAEMHFSDKNKLDTRQHGYLADLPNITQIAHDSRPHNVSIRLKAQGKLIDILDPPEVAEQEVRPVSPLSDGDNFHAS